jgi:hypothetical protein
MRMVSDIVVHIFSFDLLLLRERLARIEDQDMRALLIVFSMLADALRFVAVTCLFALFLL